MLNLPNIILIITAVSTALIGGLFYGWSVSVIRGNRVLSDKKYVAFMQATNREIQNLLFFATFFGTAVLLPVSAFLFYGAYPRFWFLLAAMVCYLLGVFGVTVVGNVPLNNRLDRFEMKAATDKEISAQRKNYEERWNFFNHIRSVFSILSILFVVLACLS